MIPPGVVDYVELVMGPEEKLIEQKRLPGENEVNRTFLYSSLFMQFRSILIIFVFVDRHGSVEDDAENPGIPRRKVHSGHCQ